MEDFCVAYMIPDQTKTENEIIFSRKMVKVKIPQIACQNVLKQYSHKNVLKIKQKLKKMDLTSLFSTEKSWPKFYIF